MTPKISSFCVFSYILERHTQTLRPSTVISLGSTPFCIEQHSSQVVSVSHVTMAETGHLLELNDETLPSSDTAFSQLVRLSEAAWADPEGLLLDERYCHLHPGADE